MVNGEPLSPTIYFFFLIIYVINIINDLPLHESNPSLPPTHIWVFFSVTLNRLYILLHCCNENPVSVTCILILLLVAKLN